MPETRELGLGYVAIDFPTSIVGLHHRDLAGGALFESVGILLDGFVTV